MASSLSSNVTQPALAPLFLRAFAAATATPLDPRAAWTLLVGYLQHITHHPVFNRLRHAR
jgi:hypothetical protein